MPFETGDWQFSASTSLLGLGDFLPRVLRQNGISTVQIRTFTRGPSLQGRVDSGRVLELADRARTNSRKSDVTFWESMINLAVDEPYSVRVIIFREALYHRADSEESGERLMATTDFVDTLTGPGFREHDSQGITAITSLVHSMEGPRHIPLLDFRASPGHENMRVITEMLNVLGVRGYLVDSGRSYHLYGADAMNIDQFYAFLGRAQLMAPFVDERWIAHQLISGKASLRVSTNAIRHTMPPRLVAWSDGLLPHLQYGG